VSLQRALADFGPWDADRSEVSRSANCVTEQSALNATQRPLICADF